jgi:hypothetical protein
MDHFLAVTIVIGKTEGLRWELNRLLEDRLTNKLIMLVPPVKGPEVRAC